MKLSNFVGIFTLAIALAAYSSWAQSARPKETLAATVDNVGAITAIPLINLKQAEVLHRDATVLFVDVRSASDFSFGRIAGAVSLPYEEFDKYFEELKPRLTRAKAIVVYCQSKDCGKSLWSAIRLFQLGLTQTKIYPNGWNEWFNNNLPVTRSVE